MRVAVVGGGWSGLAAAVRATEAGHAVALFEMAPQLGGRARGVTIDGLALDNGQHILIGAYVRTLALIRTVGADPDTLLLRLPLELRHPDGRGLALPPGPAWLAFARGLAAAQGLTWRDRLAFAATATGWALHGFRCAPGLSVAQLCSGLPDRVRELLIEPLSVAALNTPAREASAQVLLRVLRDALFSGANSSDLLLPRRSLAALLPQPAAAWLAERGAELRLGQRVQLLRRDAGSWLVDGEAFDAIVLAGPARESARLVESFAAQWAAQASALQFEPIVTAYVRAPGARLPAPMTTLADGPEAPAQFAFDLGAIAGHAGLFAFVVSGARRWLDGGLEVTGAHLLAQARGVLLSAADAPPPQLLRVLAEKRATFRCTPALRRPEARIAPGLVAAGDHVEGPYPATLEGAVRSGEAAVALLAAGAR